MTTIKRKHKSLEGIVSAIPIGTNHWSACVIARNPKYALSLGYVMRRVWISKPSLEQVSAAVKKVDWIIGVFSDLKVRSDEWPQLGVLPNWNHDVWIVPGFFFREPEKLSGYIRYYDDNLEFQGQKAVPLSEGEGCPKDGVFGSVAFLRYVQSQLGITLA